MVNVDFSKIGSPETYFGADRNELLANGMKSEVGLHTLKLPGFVNYNELNLGGTWNFTSQYAETTGNNTVVYQYIAKNVYFVGSATNTTEIKVRVDGKPPGDITCRDIANGTIIVKDEQLYKVVEGRDYGMHTLELDIAQPGLRAYTFTFG